MRRMVSFEVDTELLGQLDKLCTPIKTRSDALREAVLQYVRDGVTKDNLTDLFQRVLKKLNTMEVKGDV